MEQENKKKRGERGPSIIKKLQAKSLNKTAEEKIDYGACMLYLLFDNKDKAFRHSVGCAAPESPGLGSIYFKSPKRERMMVTAKADFEKLLAPLLEKYAKEKGLFYPSEAVKENSEAKFQAIRRNLDANRWTKDDVLAELAIMVDNATNQKEKLDALKAIADIDQMKKIEADQDKVLASVVVLPEKSNATVFNYEAYFDPQKLKYVKKEFEKRSLEDNFEITGKVV